MNTYTTEFSCACPINGDWVRYALTIETSAVIKAEELSEACDSMTGLHEEIADRLIDRFRGRQTITANHRGVNITTTREK